MGVLDELKKEAAAVRAKDDKQRGSQAAEQEAVLKKLRPRMQSLFKYLKEMADNLNVVDPDVRADYEVKGCGQLKGLRQRGYRVTTPDNRALSQFTLHYTCVADGGMKFQVKGKEAAERQRQFMWEHNLRFTSKALADGSGVFFLESYVPVSFEFQTDPEKGGVRLRVRNLDGLGASNISYEPDQLTDGYMEELAKAVLRKPNRFHELSGNALPDEMRRRLRQQLAHDSYRKLADQEAQRVKAEKNAPDGKKRGIRGIFGRT